MIGNVSVDHKTTDLSLIFKMPNLISIDRLRKLTDPLLYNFVIYDSTTKQISKIMVVDVYELNWDHLRIQNLGVGQLQIVNMVKFLESPTSTMTKEAWISRLESEAVKFYDELIVKTEQRRKGWLS